MCWDGLWPCLGSRHCWLEGGKNRLEAAIREVCKDLEEHLLCGVRGCIDWMGGGGVHDCIIIIIVDICVVGGEVVHGDSQ